MLTMLIFFKRKPGMSVDAFQKHWRTAHADIICRLPGIRRYVQNELLPSAYRKGEPPFDAVAESSFDDSEAMKALARTAQYADVLADEPNFLDRSSERVIITEQHLVKDGPVPPGALKSIAFVTHKAGMPIDEFFRYWLEDHGGLCRSVPAFRRYVQYHTRRSIYASGRTPAYDGAAISWFDSLDALREAAASPAFAKLRADLDHFTASECSPSVLVREHLVLA